MLEVTLALLAAGVICAWAEIAAHRKLLIEIGKNQLLVNGKIDALTGAICRAAEAYNNHEHETYDPSTINGAQRLEKRNG